MFSGIGSSSTLGLPRSAGSDIMHLGTLNISDLMIGLWRGTIDCTRPDDRATWDWAVLRGEVWQQHGKAVADCLHYLPSSFDHPPRNITEKLTSRYKAWEFLQYLYGLRPGLLLGVLPNVYYTNYCKLVSCHDLFFISISPLSFLGCCRSGTSLTCFDSSFRIVTRSDS